MNKFMTLCAFATVAAASTVNAQGFFDPPSKPFTLYSTFSNDGYSANRGVFFTVSSNLPANSYHWTNDMPANATLQWDLRENGIVVDTQFSNTGGGGLLDYSVGGSGFLMTTGNQYDLALTHNDNGVGNYFYAYDPAAFGDAPFNVGVITVTDGHLGNDGSNFVMPRMGINVPGPASAALLGLGGLVATRRRR